MTNEQISQERQQMIREEAQEQMIERCVRLMCATIVRLKACMVDLGYYGGVTAGPNDMRDSIGLAQRVVEGIASELPLPAMDALAAADKDQEIQGHERLYDLIENSVKETLISIAKKHG